MHVITALCAAQDLHMVVPGPMGHVEDSSQCSEEIVNNLELCLSVQLLLLMLIWLNADRSLQQRVGCQLPCFC